MAIVSVQCMHTPLKRKGSMHMVYVSVQCIKIPLIIKQIREGVAIVSVQCMHTPLIN